jgi:hypothetical protein
MEFSPEQFGHVVGSDPGVRGKSLPALADTYYNREPDYMSRLESHVKQNGFQTPVGVRFNDRAGNYQIQGGGHHRAAVAARLGIPLPATDLSDDPAARPDAVHESWSQSFTRSPEEQKSRNTLGERGDKGYKTRMK